MLHFMSILPVRLFLAPMEGITDWIMRDTLTALGGVDVCVTEFLRVTKVLHPKKVFMRHCPELLMTGQTRAGTPVFFQLLGGEPNPVADNAIRAAELGARGIDLNFGCPAKTVNRHDGGAVLLKSPQRLYDIAKVVRNGVPSQVPVTAKIRLGYEDTSLCKENALALEEAGVSWLTVHCRTKTDGYRPPAHWHWIPQIKNWVKVPVIANGDITSVERFRACRQETGAEWFMIGRGSLSDPFLFKKIQEQELCGSEVKREWQEVKAMLVPFYHLSCEQVNPYFATSRTKQWLKHLALNHVEARELFQKIKTFTRPDEFYLALEKNVFI